MTVVQEWNGMALTAKANEQIQGVLPEEFLRIWIEEITHRLYDCDTNRQGLLELAVTAKSALAIKLIVLQAAIARKDELEPLCDFFDDFVENAIDSQREILALLQSQWDADTTAYFEHKCQKVWGFVLKSEMTALEQILNNPIVLIKFI
jgi:hypothetical protein